MTTRITPGVGANLLGQHSAERNQDATAYVGCLDPQVTEELLWELFVQAGPVANVYVPKDRVSNLHQGYGFVEFRSEEDADYAIKILNMIKLYGKPIRVNKASQDKKSADVGANLFIGNLDPDVDDKLLHDTFSAFGPILGNPKIMRDPETGNSKGFGFISYDSFEASDAAIEAMAGQYLQNRPITVSYAYKKDTKGERHGTQAERMLAASNPSAQKSRPNTMFASGPPTLVGPPVLAQPNGSMGLMMNGGMAHHHQQHHHVYNAVQMMPPPPQVQIAQYGMPPHPHMHHHHLPPHPQMIWRAPPPPPPPQPMQPPPLQLQQHLQLQQQQQQQQQQQLSAAAPPPPPPQYHRPPPPAARPPPPPPPPIPSAPAAPTITTTTAAAAAPPSPPPPPPPVSSSSSSPPPSPSSSAPPPSSPPPPPVSAAASSSPSACASPPS